MTDHYLRILKRKLINNEAFNKGISAGETWQCLMQRGDAVGQPGFCTRTKKSRNTLK